MKRPNIERKADQIAAHIEKYVNERVRPYLQELLNKAQKRLSRHPLHFTQGMGAWSIWAGEENWEFFPSWIEEKLHPRFPELEEFLEIVQQVDEHLNAEVGDMKPT